MPKDSVEEQEPEGEDHEEIICLKEDDDDLLKVLLCGQLIK